MKAYEKLQQFMKDKHSQPDWETAWRELAQLTLGIEKRDPRFHSICDALDQCDQCFEQDDFPAFQQAAERVKKILNNQL